MKKSFIITLCMVYLSLFSSDLRANDNPLSFGILLWRGETPVDQAFITEIKKNFKHAVFYQNDSKQKIRETVNIIQLTWKQKLPELDYIFSFGSRNSLKVRDLLKENGFKGTHLSFANTQELYKAFKIRKENKERLILARPLIQPASLLHTFLPIVPIKKIGVPFNVFEPQNKDLLTEIDKLSKLHNINISPIRTRPSETTFIKQIKLVLDKDKDINTLLLMQDSFLISQADKLAKLCQERRLICIGANSKYIDHSIPLVLAVDYADMGRSMAKQVISVENGKSVFEQPIIYGKNNQVIANRNILSKLLPDIIDKLPKNTKFINP